MLNHNVPPRRLDCIVVIRGGDAVEGDPAGRLIDGHIMNDANVRVSRSIEDVAVRKGAIGAEALLLVPFKNKPFIARKLVGGGDID